MVFSEASFLTKIVVNDFMEVPINMGVKAKHNLTLKQSVIASCSEPGLLVYDEGGHGVRVLTVYQPVVQQ